MLLFVLKGPLLGRSNWLDLGAGVSLQFMMGTLPTPSVECTYHLLLNKDLLG
jgi:hypothetical protein